jgi:D-glycero-alpha-D-manno-heptose 1-phosphate guanylyltransferase
LRTTIDTVSQALKRNQETTVNTTANTLPRADSLRENLPAVLLVGGMGTRLQPILPSTPKPLAPIGDIPFLQLLVLQLRSQGIRRLVLCTGHLANQIEEQFGDGRKWDVTIEYSKESSPLGTAGALKFAGRYLSQDSEFLVMNGDSFLELDFRQFIRFHRQQGGWASIAVRRVPNAARYGTVQLDALDRVLRFSEKMGIQEPGVINGGVYLFNRAILQHIPDGTVSLEKDVLPGLVEHGIYALEQKGMFIDIGTPEDYARARALHLSLCQAAFSDSQLGSPERPPR